MKKNICIIDDHEIIRTGIRRVLNQSDDYDVVYEFPSNASLLNQPITKPLDIIIQDLDLEDGCNLSQLEILSYKCPKVPVLIYTMHPESMYGLACLKYNIAGYLTKDKPIRDLLTAIDTICSGNNYFTPELNQLLANHYINKDTASVDHLSQREQEVFVLIGEGFTPTEIAKKLFINIKTVSTYRRRILDKLNLSTTNQIIRLYLANKTSKTTPR
ncbi:MAG: response regulator [Candidatus Marinamargulisbacteria bacterium]